MITLLKRDHFEAIRAQMECKEHSKISLKDIPDLTDIPKYKSTMSMLTHIWDFESYLVTHYGVEGFPLDYVVRPKLAHAYWHTFQPQNRAYIMYNVFPTFFQFNKTDFNCRKWAQIIPN